MKRHIKYLAFGISALTISLFITDLCAGQSDNETVYYNNPDIISNRLQREQAAEKESVAELYRNTKLVFAAIEEAQKILTAKDKYINSQTPYDRRLRLNREEPVSVKEYLDFISEQALDWSESEKAKIREIVQNIKPRLEEYELNLPSEIFLIKTTGREGGAAYCRGKAIVLPQTLLDIEVTNPDVPQDRYCIELEYKGKNINVIPIITVPDFNPARNLPFFLFLKLQLVEVEKIDGQYKYKRDESGKPIVYDQRQLPDYVKKVGENTSYLIHPEEILADNFAIMVFDKKPVKSKWVIDKMKPLLENKNKNVVGIK